MGGVSSSHADRARLTIRETKPSFTSLAGGASWDSMTDLTNRVNSVLLDYDWMSGQGYHCGQ